ncbi:MAG: hypothetical protein ACYC91_00825 [Solirubrobacteraceae bacterium]
MTRKLSLAVPLALMIAGCGGSSSSGLGHAALVTKVDAVCKHRNEIITAAASKVLAGGNLPGPAVFGKLAHQTIIPQYAAQIGELGALKASSQLASQYEQWLRDSRATLARMRQNPRIITNSANFTALNGEATVLGFSSNCRVGPS